MNEERFLEHEFGDVSRLHIGWLSWGPPASWVAIAAGFAFAAVVVVAVFSGRAGASGKGLGDIFPQPISEWYTLGLGRSGFRCLRDRRASLVIGGDGACARRLQAVLIADVPSHARADSRRQQGHCDRYL